MSLSPKNIAILGSTGSIGRSSLEVIERLSDRFRATYLTANKNIELLRQQIERHRPRGVAVFDKDSAAQLRKLVDASVEVLSGEEGVLEIVKRDDVDVVISSLVGFAGLKPTVEAIQHRKDIALANKETLVVAGMLITALQKEFNVRLIPIDSEHSAVLQCLAGEDPEHISRLILTASGGPLLHTPSDSFSEVTVEQALNHPNWKMGKKITIDSATLMNKGLEVIEAHWLFHLPPEKIEVVIHPQSVIHSMVEFVDGSIKAQLGVPDMKLPIQYALTYPERSPMNGARLDFPKLQSMTFFAPDKTKFRCLQLAYDALGMGGTAPAALNAANEVAVEAFLERQIRLQQIPELIDRVLSHHHVVRTPELADIVEADQTARRRVHAYLRH
jgi:1-deoxy-D-xylulose-5-phosphate reductoisomerase